VMAALVPRPVPPRYQPPPALRVPEAPGQWRSTPAVGGALTSPGLIVFQFGASLFYANAGRFVDDVRQLVNGAPAPVRWLVIDAGAITNIDYSAARVFRDLCEDLAREGVTLPVVHGESSLRADLERHGLLAVIGADRIFDTLREALAAISGGRDVAEGRPFGPPPRPPDKTSTGSPPG